MFSEIKHTACPEVGSFWLGPKLSGFYADFTQIFEVHNLYMGFKRILQYFYAGYTEKIRWFPATKNDVNIAVGYMFLRSRGQKMGLALKGTHFLDIYEHNSNFVSIVRHRNLQSLIRPLKLCLSVGLKFKALWFGCVFWFSNSKPTMLHHIMIWKICRFFK